MTSAVGQNMAPFWNQKENGPCEFNLGSFQSKITSDLFQTREIIGFLEKKITNTN